MKQVTSWSAAGWRRGARAQMPDYPDPAALARVEARLAASAPLAAVADILHCKAQLAQVAAGRAFVLQGGDCAESFAEFGADKVRTTFNLLLRMGAMLRASSGTEIVHLARIAGQFAKPRSSTTETVGSATLPSYRGDAVNGPDACSPRTAKRRRRSRCSPLIPPPPTPTCRASTASSGSTPRPARSACSPATRRCCSTTNRR